MSSCSGGSECGIDEAIDGARRARRRGASLYEQRRELVARDQCCGRVLGSVHQGCRDDTPDDLTGQISSVDGDVSGFSGVTQLTFDDVIELDEVALPEASYVVERSQFVADVVAVLDFAGHDGNGQIAVSSAPGGGRSLLVTFAS